MKRILFVSADEKQDLYGYFLAQFLPASEFEVETISLTGVGDLPWGLSDFVFNRRLKKRAQDFDIIYVRGTLEVQLKALKVAKSLGKKFVVKLDSDDVWERAVAFWGLKDDLITFSFKPSGHGMMVDKLKKQQRFIVSSADKVIVPNLYLQKIAGRWGVSEEKMDIVHNSFESFDFGDLSLGNKETKDILLVTFGEMMVWNNFSFLIDVVFDLLPQYPDIKLYIYGDGPEKTKLESLVDEYNLASRVFLPGEVSAEELFKHIHYADVFVSNDSYAPDFSFLLGVMSVGTPIIATEIDSNPELIGDGHNGLLVPPNDKIAWRGAISMLADNPNVRLELVSNAKKILDKYSEERMRQALVNILNDL